MDAVWQQPRTCNFNDTKMKPPIWPLLQRLKGCQFTHKQPACLSACLHCAAVTGTFDVELAQLVFAPWPANPAQYSHGKSPNQHSYMQLQVGVISAIQP